MIDLTHLLGIGGSFLLAACAIPEVISSWRKGYCGASGALLITWFLGELITLIYICLTSLDIFLLFNYSSNCIMVGILLYFKTRPVKHSPIFMLTDLKDLK